MIVVTGGAGFIGSCVVARLNELNKEEILVVDSLGTSDKWMNLRNLKFIDYIDKDDLFPFLENHKFIEAIIHMGACSATTERDAHYLMENNYRYTLRLAEYAVNHDVRFIYASSAATYGDGELGYDDDLDQIHRLKPMNMYGYSKQLFDLKALREGWFDAIAGLKFFNVYGPNEYHKDDMCSVVFKAFEQIQTCGEVKLFKSHRPDYVDGGQLRDFVYVKDVVDMMIHLMKNPTVSGLFNAGTGSARSFKDLVTAVFNAMEKPVNISYIDMPEHLRDRYQYYTQAEMARMRAAGHTAPIRSLEDGVRDYVTQYLMKGRSHWHASYD